jgi:hypothetical protein
MYQFSLKPYYDNVRQCYKQIITVFPKPEGALARISKQLRPTQLSPFRNFSDCDPYPRCFYAITDPHNQCDLLRIEDIALLLNFLSRNGYVVDNQITKTLMRANTPLGETLLFYVKLKAN